MIISSLLALFSSGLFRLGSYSIYGRETDRPKLVLALSLVFPIHFALLEQASYAYEEKRIEHELQKLSETIASAVLPAAEEARLFQARLRRLNAVHFGASKVREIFVRAHAAETLLERLPQAVVQLSLVFASREHERLKTLFYSIFEFQFGLPGDFLLGLSVVTSAWGVAGSVRHIKNGKRFPVTPSLVGTGLQVSGYQIIACSNAVAQKSKTETGK